MNHKPISLTVDVEEYQPSENGTGFVRAMRPLLQLLEELEVTATFFVVGKLAPRCDELLMDLHQRGHEIALHGYTHRFLKDLTPKEFREELLSGRGTLENIIQEPVVGFRAPYFSLTRECLWAPQVLTDEGFLYSSSVMPSFNPRVGISNSPRSPFRWPSGLIEFPAPTFGIGGMRIPLLGGPYLRLSPSWLVAWAKYSRRNSSGTWTYCHPFDFDVDEEFSILEGNSWFFARLLFARRKLMSNRIRNMLTPESPTLRRLAQLEATHHDMPIWCPDPLELVHLL